LEDLVARTVKITNKNHFTDLSDLSIVWEVIIDGEAVSRGDLPALAIAPQRSESVIIPFAAPELEPRQEVFLNIRLALNTDTSWAPAGHEIAWEHFMLPYGVPVTDPLPVDQMPTLNLEDGPDKVVITNDRLRVVFDKQVGQLAEFRYDDRALLTTGPTLNAWRAATDNDGFKLWPENPKKSLGQWLMAGLDRLQYQTESITVEQLRPQVIRVAIQTRAIAEGLEAGIGHRHIYTLYGSGDLQIESEFEADESLPSLPRLGLTMSLDAGFEDLTWYGRGPFENYIDRNVGAPIGRYHSTVTEQYVPYIMPQENGNKTDVRWLNLSDSQSGVSLLSVAHPTMEASADHFTADDLHKAFHTNDVPQREEVILNLDYMQRGLGGASCGPDTLDQYRLEPGKYSFNVRLRPYKVDEADPAELARQQLEVEG
jgi:beta-galactosidase